MAGTIYIDRRGWKFKVMQGLGTEFKARYQKPGKTGWKCVAVLPWRESKAEAELDLDDYAKRHHMKEFTSWAE